MARLLLLTVVLIAYGSLYPWQFRAAAFEHSPLWLLFHNWSAHLDAITAKDMAVNVLVYLPLGFFAVETFAVYGGAPLAVVAAVLTGFALSTSVELAQFFVVGRVSSAVDVATNTLGSAIGAAAAAVWIRVPHRHSRRPDSIFVLCCWVLAQCFPFVPHVPHRRPPTASSPVDTLLQFGGSLVLVPLAASVTKTTRSRLLLLAGLLLLIPLRLFIFTRTATLWEITVAAVVFAIGCVAVPPARYAAAALGAILVIHGLAPFAFQAPPKSFSWIPFQASFISEWEPALTILLGKLFLYGALLWLTRESDVRLMPAMVIVAALLTAIEVSQMYLPVHSSEITDPLIALIAAWVFSALKPRRRLKSLHGAF